LCGRDVALRAAGQLREHAASDEQAELDPGLRICPASGYTVNDTKESVARELNELEQLCREGRIGHG
jgi:hypothetical protein